MRIKFSISASLRTTVIATVVAALSLSFSPCPAENQDKPKTELGQEAAAKGDKGGVQNPPDTSKTGLAVQKALYKGIPATKGSALDNTLDFLPIPIQNCIIAKHVLLRGKHPAIDDYFEKCTDLCLMTLEAELVFRAASASYTPLIAGRIRAGMGRCDFSPAGRKKLEEVLQLDQFVFDLIMDSSPAAAPYDLYSDYAKFQEEDKPVPSQPPKPGKDRFPVPWVKDIDEVVKTTAKWRSVIVSGGIKGLRTEMDHFWKSPEASAFLLKHPSADHDYAQKYIIRIIIPMLQTAAVSDVKKSKTQFKEAEAAMLEAVRAADVRIHGSLVQLPTSAPKELQLSSGKMTMSVSATDSYEFKFKCGEILSDTEMRGDPTIKIPGFADRKDYMPGMQARTIKTASNDCEYMVDGMSIECKVPSAEFLEFGRKRDEIGIDDIRALFEKASAETAHISEQMDGLYALQKSGGITPEAALSRIQTLDHSAYIIDSYFNPAMDDVLKNNREIVVQFKELDARRKRSVMPFKVSDIGSEIGKLVSKRNTILTPQSTDIPLKDEAEKIMNASIGLGILWQNVAIAEDAIRDGAVSEEDVEDTRRILAEKSLSASEQKLSIAGRLSEGFIGDYGKNIGTLADTVKKAEEATPPLIPEALWTSGRRDELYQKTVGSLNEYSATLKCLKDVLVGDLPARSAINMKIINSLAGIKTEAASSPYSPVKYQSRKYNLNKPQLENAVYAALMAGDGLEIMSLKHMTEKAEGVFSMDSNLYSSPHARILYLQAKSPEIELAKEMTATLAAAMSETIVLKLLGKDLSPTYMIGMMDALNDPGDTVYGRKAYCETVTVYQFIIDYMTETVTGTTPGDLWGGYMEFHESKRGMPPISRVETSVDPLPWDSSNALAVKSGNEWRSIITEKGLKGVMEELDLFWGSSDKAKGFAEKNSSAKVDYARRYIRTRMPALLATAANRRFDDLKYPTAEAVLDMSRAIEESKIVVKGRILSLPLKDGTPVSLVIHGENDDKTLEAKTGADGRYSFEVSVREAANKGLSVVIGKSTANSKLDITDRDCAPSMLYVEDGRAVQLVKASRTLTATDADVEKLSWNQAVELMDQILAEMKSNADSMKALGDNPDQKMVEEAYDWNSRLGFFANTIMRRMRKWSVNDSTIKEDLTKYSANLEKCMEKEFFTGLKDRGFKRALELDKFRRKSVYGASEPKTRTALLWISKTKEVAVRWAGCEAFQMFYDVCEVNKDGAVAAQILQIRKNNAKMCAGATAKLLEEIRKTGPDFAASLDDEIENCRKKLKEIEDVGMATEPMGITGSNICSDYEHLRENTQELVRDRRCIDIMSKWDLNAMQTRNMEALRRLRLIE
ncbi:MAG: hypothetical protein WAX69_01580 [Victivallales bacterium]